MADAAASLLCTAADTAAAGLVEHALPAVHAVPAEHAVPAVPAVPGANAALAAGAVPYALVAPAVSAAYAVLHEPSPLLEAAGHAVLAGVSVTTRVLHHAVHAALAVVAPERACEEQGIPSDLHAVFWASSPRSACCAPLAAAAVKAELSWGQQNCAVCHFWVAEAGLTLYSNRLVSTGCHLADSNGFSMSRLMSIV